MEFEVRHVELVELFAQDLPIVQYGLRLRGKNDALAFQIYFSDHLGYLVHMAFS